MTSTTRLVRHFGCVVAVGWCASGCLDPLIEDPSVTGAADVPRAPDVPAYEDGETVGPVVSEPGTTSGSASTDGGGLVIFSVPGTRDAGDAASTWGMDAGPDGGQSSSDVDTGVDASDMVLTSDDDVDGDASVATDAP
jgi:hypothetical protein